MIVSRAPVRFSLGGGGSDLPSYCSEHGGFVVSAAVDKFVFVCVARRFYDTIRLAYSETETVSSVDEIRHRIFRAALKGMGFTGGLELHSLADVPANTGLGSSSSFTVALVNGLHAFRRESVPAEQLAREACQLEIDVLREPIGKQDQYIAAYGGISAMTFHPDGRVVNVVPVKSLTEAVRRANVATQTVGVYPPSRKAELRDALAAAGAQRVVELGKAIAFEVGISHDGFHPLQRFVRWVNDEG